MFRKKFNQESLSLQGKVKNSFIRCHSKICHKFRNTKASQYKQKKNLLKIFIFFSFHLLSEFRNIFFPTSSLKMTFPSLNLEMKVGVCITCEESKSLPSLVGKVKKKLIPI
jgi:hypothetical protein